MSESKRPAYKKHLLEPDNVRLDDTFNQTEAGEEV